MKAIEQKLARLRAGAPPRVLDLFSGCGGFSLGFQRAGFTIVGGLEMDPDAAASHAWNFHGRVDGPHAQSRDITTQDPHQLLQALGAPEGIDVIIGGPPCPAFARIGRAKLREIHAHPTAFQKDPRAQLYVPYLEYVRALRPLAIVMENVPELLNFGGHNLAEEICETLEAEGMEYRCRYTLLNSVHYGVPQMRERFFLVGVHQSVEGRFAFPKPTHEASLPPGYIQSQLAATKTLTGAVGERFVARPTTAESVPGVSAAQALGDLPALLSHLKRPGDRSPRFLDARSSVPRQSGPVSDYVQRHMLDWPGFERSRGDDVWAHVTRGLGHRDHRIFRSMAPGDQYPEAWRLAQESWLAFRRDVAGPAGLDALQDRAASLLPMTLALWHLCRETVHEVEDITRVQALWDEFRERLADLRTEAQVAAGSLRELAQTLEFVPRIRPTLVETDAPAAIDELLASFERPDWGRIPDLVQRLAPNWRQCLRRYRRSEALRAAESWAAGHEVEGVPSVTRELGIKSFRAAFEEVEAAVRELPLEPVLFWSSRTCAPGLLGLASMEVAAISDALNVLVDIQAEFVPPYDPAKFPNRWRKMESDAPARTLMAHLGKDTYSHIHYDSEQARTISVREAARLQSFPDGFEFQGRMNSGFRQIGNAVPPLMAFALARSLRTALGVSGEDDPEGGA